MALSGNFYSSGYETSSGDNICLKFSWTAKQSEEDNTSEISWTLTGSRNEDGQVGAGGFKVVIDGDTVYSKSTDYRIKLYNGTVITSGKKTLTHDSEGKRSFEVSIKAGIYYYAVNCTGSEEFTLTTIPRASTITSASNVTLGNTCSVKWTPKAKTFYYKLVLELGDFTKTIKGIAPKSTSAYTYAGCTIPIDGVAPEITESKTGKMTVTLTTHTASSCTDENQVGSESSKTFTVTVPDNSTTRPTVTMDLTPVNPPITGLYIQGKTKVKATLKATGKYGAKIDAYSMRVDGVTYDADDDLTSGILTNYGSITVYGYAKDTRGITGNTSKSITVIAYSKPQIQNAEAFRCDADGNPSDSGTYLKILATRRYSPVASGDEQHNFCTIRYRYKLENAAGYGDWTTILPGDNLNGNEIETAALLNGALDAKKTYIVQVGVVDTVGESSVTTIVVPTDKVYQHRDGARNAYTFGGYVEDDDTFTIAAGIAFKVKSLTGETVVISDTGWISLELSDAVTAPEKENGRNGPGCYYRVINGNHVYVAFCCACTYTGSVVYVNRNLIPKQYRPLHTVFTLSAATSRNIVRAYVSNYGNVAIEYVQRLASATETDAADIPWVDGYVDYWI